MEKKDIRVSDAIPEMPYSFEQTVERTLKKVCTEQKKPVRTAKTALEDRRVPQVQTRTGKTRQRIGRVFAYSAVAVLLVAVFAIGGVVMKNTLFGQDRTPNPLAGTETDPPQAPAVNPLPTVQTHKVTIQLIPDFDDPKVYEKAREEAHQPAFSEEDWGWIRKIGVTIEDITVNDQAISWTTVFSIPPEIQPERFSQNPFTLGIQENGMTLFGNGTDLYWNGVTEDLAYNSVAGTRVDLNTGTWYVEETTVMSRPETDFSGIVEVHQQFRMQDSNVDPQQPISTVALIEQTFTFSVTPVPETPNTLVPAIRYNMLLYTLSDVEFAGEIDESAITGRVSSVVPLSEWPRMHGETNFGKIGMPYAETENGLVVLFENEWRLMEPVMPDPAAGVIDAACAQVLAERKEIDERYRHTGTMTEEEIGELDAEANFNHQRLVKLMNLWAKAVSVEQEDGQMRLSQIAFDEDKLYFAFAASPDCAFDSAPVIGVNGHSYATGDESGFIGLKATETEHYAFYSVYPGTLSGTVLITVANNNNNFCFQYHADDGTAALPQDIETAQQWLKKLDYVTPAPHCDVDPAADALCLFVDGDKTYKPFENWVWSDHDDGLSADGMTFLWKMEEVKDKIPTIHNPAELGVKAGENVNLERTVNIYGEALNTVAFGVSITTVRTLDPGTYYVSQRVSRREEGRTAGYECVVRVEIGDVSGASSPVPSEEPNPRHIPMICYGGEVYGMHAEERPGDPGENATFGTVTSVISISEIPERDGQANFGSVGMRFAVTNDGLVVWYNNEWRLFVPEEPGGNPDKVLWNDPNAFPGLFRFWDYDEVIGDREAPASGVLFRCDFDGDGTEDEVAYEIHGQYLTISLGKKSIDVNFGAGLEQAILLDLDPDSARLNLLVVYNTGSEDYETAELHMENGRFVRGPVIFAYCSCEADSVRGSSTQTDILGTKTGERTYHGEDLTPDSEWYDCEVIPTADEILSDRAHLIEWGKLLHIVRDLPCTIDGADAVIPAGSYIYMTRWHESGALAEIRTEDGTTALVAVREADPNDPDLAGCLIDGVMQYEYFDNIFFAD